MALIFDRFPSIEKAAGFAAAVKENYGRESQLYTKGDEAAEAGFFPFRLDGTVVLVERESYDNEEAIIQLVKAHSGEFAGT